MIELKSGDDIANINEPAVEEERKKRRIPKSERKKFDLFLRVIFSLCQAFGYHLEGRIKVKDLESGRVWK